MAEAAAPVEHREPVVSPRREREHVRERDEHVVRVRVAGQHLGRLVVDAERLWRLDRGEVVRPFARVRVGDGLAAQPRVGYDQPSGMYSHSARRQLGLPTEPQPASTAWTTCSASASVSSGYSGRLTTCAQSRSATGTSTRGRCAYAACLWIGSG